MNRTKAVTMDSNPDQRLQLCSLAEQLRLPDERCFVVAVGDFLTSVTPCHPLCSAPSGAGKSPRQHTLCLDQPCWHMAPRGSRQLAALGAARGPLGAMLGLAWAQLWDWWAVTGSSLVAISLLPSESQLGAAEDLAQCVILATGCLSLVTMPVGSILSKEQDGKNGYTCTDKL